MPLWNLPGVITTGNPLTQTWLADVNADLNVLEALVGLFGYTGEAAGSPPAIGSPSFAIQCGTQALAFSSGLAALSFPNAFPNALIAFTANIFTSGSPVALTWYSPSTSGVELNIAGGPSASFSISWIAIGA